MTFRQTFVRTLSRHLWYVAAVFAVLFVMSMQQNSQTMAERPPVERSPHVMVKDCKPTVVGEFPARVLIQRLNDGGEWVTSDKQIGKALDDKFGNKDWKGVNVLAFCG